MQTEKCPECHGAGDRRALCKDGYTRCVTCFRCGGRGYVIKQEAANK